MNFRSRYLFAAAGLLAIAAPSFAGNHDSAISEDELPRALRKEDLSFMSMNIEPDLILEPISDSLLADIVDKVNDAGIDLELSAAATALEATGGVVPMESPEALNLCSIAPNGFTCRCWCLLFVVSIILGPEELNDFRLVCLAGELVPGLNGDDVNNIVGVVGVVNNAVDVITDGTAPLLDAFGAVVGFYDYFCRRALREGEEPVQEEVPRDRRLEIVQSMEHIGAKSDSTFSFKYELISKNSCDTLIKHMDDSLRHDIDVGTELNVGAYPHGVDEKYDSWTPFNGGIDNQYNHKLYADELVELIGKDEAMKLIDYFEETLGDLTIDCMYLARHGEVDIDSENIFVPWHKDNYATLEITLNDNYDGGHVLHLNADGVHKTDARPGSATAHMDDIVHGITPNTGGPKYMLILKHHFKRADKEGVVRLSKELVNASAARLV